MEFTQCHFLVPDPAGFSSGGNIYNAQLIRALGKLGLHISHSEFDPDIFYGSPDTRYILDSLYFSRITQPDLQIPAHCVGLIHHLASLFPGDAHFRIELETEILNTLDRFLVSSSFTEAYLISLGYQPDRIHVIEPAPMQTRLTRTPSRKVHALVLGSCIERKGQLLLLKSLAALDVPPYYELVLAGSLTVDEEYAHACQEIVLNSDHLKKCVRFTGEQDATVIDKLYQQANLFISSSAMETFGMAIQDAVESGIPVLALEGGYAARHVVHGENGLSCPDPVVLARSFASFVTDSDRFLKFQHQAAIFKHPYHTWDQAGEAFATTFLPGLV